MKDSGKLWKTFKSAISSTKKSNSAGSQETADGLTFEATPDIARLCKLFPHFRLENQGKYAIHYLFTLEAST